MLDRVWKDLEKLKCSHTCDSNTAGAAPAETSVEVPRRDEGLSNPEVLFMACIQNHWNWSWKPTTSLIRYRQENAFNSSWAREMAQESGAWPLLIITIIAYFNFSFYVLFENFIHFFIIFFSIPSSSRWSLLSTHLTKCSFPLLKEQKNKQKATTVMESCLCHPAALEHGARRSMVDLPSFTAGIWFSLSLQIDLNHFFHRGRTLCPRALLCPGNFFRLVLVQVFCVLSQSMWVHACTHMLWDTWKRLFP